MSQGTGSFKRSKHIKIRYFWMKSLQDNGLITLKYTPTDELVADSLTKPLTGGKFLYLRTKLIGWTNRFINRLRGCVKPKRVQFDEGITKSIRYTKK